MQQPAVPGNSKKSGTFSDLFILLVLSAASAGFGARLLSLEFVDQRFHKLVAGGLGWRDVVFSATAMFLIFSAEYFQLGKESSGAAAKKVLFANIPLCAWLLCWVMPLSYSMLPLYIVCGSWAAARWAGMTEFTFDLSWKKVFTVIGIAALLAGTAGGLWQVWSYEHLGMQWFDWGHFYEVLTNTLKGKFFYLDLVQGCFLGSRFCISLIFLLPVAILHSPEIFLITGALLVASGAVLLTLGAKILKLDKVTALGCGAVFLLSPMAVNMMLAQLDGFHEVFMFIPVVFGAWCCYRAGHRKWAVVLWVISLGIRETVGFMWVMWGIVLMFEKTTRRDGFILSAVSGIWTILLLTVIMPAISASSGGYVHTVFFPHLGNSIFEIALSPVTRPAAFWGKLFSIHNLDYALELLLPFILTLIIAPKYLLIMLPDFLMIMMDFRFDSQNLLRHYQIVPLMVLMIAFVEAAAEINRGRQGKCIGFIRRVVGKNTVNALVMSGAASGVLSCCCFAQIPFFPASDPRLLEWSSVRGEVEELYRLIPPGERVTAGAGMACYFAGRNELNVYRHDVDREVFDNVVIESFMPVYGENELRIKLVSSGMWEVKYSAYVDDRLLQLLTRRKDGKNEIAVPKSVFYISDKEWQQWGSPVPNRNPDIDIRGRIVSGYLLIGVRLGKKIDYDFGVTVNIEYKDLPPISFFTSFGDGIYPACIARTGEVWVMTVPLEDVPQKCRVDQSLLPMKASNYIYK